MPAAEHEQWRFDPRSGSILGPNNQLVAVVEDREKEAIGRVFVRAFQTEERLDAAIEMLAECCGETTVEIRKRLGMEG